MQPLCNLKNNATFSKSCYICRKTLFLNYSTLITALFIQRKQTIESKKTLDNFIVDCRVSCKRERNICRNASKYFVYVQIISPNKDNPIRFMLFRFLQFDFNFLIIVKESKNKERYFLNFLLLLFYMFIVSVK